MDVVQKKREDVCVLDYWNRFKEVIQKHTDWMVDDDADMKQPDLVNVLVGEMLPDVREEIELRTVGWRKKSAPELVEIAQITYHVLQKQKEKIEKKERTKIMNVQTPVTQEKGEKS